MYFWSQIDSSNTVINVVVNDVKPEGNFIQTFQDGTRGHYGSVGHTWDGTNFIPPCPHKGWLLNGINWEPPIPYPGHDMTRGRYVRRWNDETLNWD